MMGYLITSVLTLLLILVVIVKESWKLIDRWSCKCMKVRGLLFYGPPAGVVICVKYYHLSTIVATYWVSVIDFEMFGTGRILTIIVTSAYTYTVTSANVIEVMVFAI